LNTLTRIYGINLLAGCETRTDWQFITNKEDKFSNLIGNGQPTRGTFASNTRIWEDQA
jgi:hypothetical protein